MFPKMNEQPKGKHLQRVSDLFRVFFQNQWIISDVFSIEPNSEKKNV